jgi:hypothetical protein
MRRIRCLLALSNGAICGVDARGFSAPADPNLTVTEVALVAATIRAAKMNVG